MSLVRIKATINNSGDENHYFLRTFEASVNGEQLEDAAIEKVPGVVVHLTWTKNPDEARNIQGTHGQDFINRLPKMNNRTYSLSDV